jgi:predicted nucleic acid-binding protein
VVDANIIMAALIKRSFTLDLLYSEKLELYVPEFLFSEIEKHKNEICKKSGISEDKLKLFLDIIKTRFNIISSQELVPFMEEAIKISPDPSDTAYFALALKYNVPIWSNEKRLKRQSGINILTTKELNKLLK